jgi:hypothetical protein
MVRETFMMTDEANFYMNGQVTSCNVRCYAPKGNPPRNFVYDVSNDRRKLTVWAGLINNTVVGPVFVNGNLTGQKYLDIINNIVEPQLRQLYGQQRNGAIRRVWYMQDGAGPHRQRQVHNRLQELFPNRVIGLDHGVEWPPRSPDLAPLDFFLWGYIKFEVYSVGPPQTLQVLQQRIVNAFTALRRTRITRRAMNSITERAQKCINNQGRQFEGRAGQ